MADLEDLLDYARTHVEEPPTVPQHRLRLEGVNALHDIITSLGKQPDGPKIPALELNPEPWIGDSYRDQLRSWHFKTGVTPAQEPSADTKRNRYVIEKSNQEYLKANHPGISTIYQAMQGNERNPISDDFAKHFIPDEAQLFNRAGADSYEKQRAQIFNTYWGYQKSLEYLVNQQAPTDTERQRAFDDLVGDWTHPSNTVVGSIPPLPRQTPQYQRDITATMNQQGIDPIDGRVRLRPRSTATPEQLWDIYSRWHTSGAAEKPKSDPFRLSFLSPSERQIFDDIYGDELFEHYRRKQQFYVARNRAEDLTKTAINRGRIEMHVGDDITPGRPSPGIAGIPRFWEMGTRFDLSTNPDEPDFGAREFAPVSAFSRWLLTTAQDIQVGEAQHLARTGGENYNWFRENIPGARALTDLQSQVGPSALPFIASGMASPRILLPAYPPKGTLAPPAIEQALGVSAGPLTMATLALAPATGGGSIVLSGSAYIAMMLGLFDPLVPALHQANEGFGYLANLPRRVLGLEEIPRERIQTWPGFLGDWLKSNWFPKSLETMNLTDAFNFLSTHYNTGNADEMHGLLQKAIPSTLYLSNFLTKLSEQAPFPFAPFGNRYLTDSLSHFVGSPVDDYTLGLLYLGAAPATKSMAKILGWTGASPRMLRNPLERITTGPLQRERPFHLFEAEQREWMYKQVLNAFKNARDVPSARAILLRAEQEAANRGPLTPEFTAYLTSALDKLADFEARHRTGSDFHRSSPETREAFMAMAEPVMNLGLTQAWWTATGELGYFGPVESARYAADFKRLARAMEDKDYTPPVNPGSLTLRGSLGEALRPSQIHSSVDALFRVRARQDEILRRRTIGTQLIRTALPDLERMLSSLDNLISGDKASITAGIGAQHSIVAQMVNRLKQFDAGLLKQYKTHPAYGTPMHKDLESMYSGFDFGAPTEAVPEPLASRLRQQFDDEPFALEIQDLSNRALHLRQARDQRGLGPREEAMFEAYNRRLAELLSELNIAQAEQLAYQSAGNILELNPWRRDILQLPESVIRTIGGDQLLRELSLKPSMFSRSSHLARAVRNWLTSVKEVTEETLPKRAAGMRWDLYRSVEDMLIEHGAVRSGIYSKNTNSWLAAVEDLAAGGSNYTWDNARFLRLGGKPLVDQLTALPADQIVPAAREAAKRYLARVSAIEPKLLDLDKAFEAILNEPPGARLPDFKYFGDVVRGTQKRLADRTKLREERAGYLTELNELQERLNNWWRDPNKSWTQPSRFIIQDPAGPLDPRAPYNKFPFNPEGLDLRGTSYVKGIGGTPNPAEISTGLNKFLDDLFIDPTRQALKQEAFGPLRTWLSDHTLSAYEAWQEVKSRISADADIMSRGVRLEAHTRKLLSKEADALKLTGDAKREWINAQTELRLLHKGVQQIGYLDHLYLANKAAGVGASRKWKAAMIWALNSRQREVQGLEYDIRNRAAHVNYYITGRNLFHYTNRSEYLFDLLSEAKREYDQAYGMVKHGPTRKRAMGRAREKVDRLQAQYNRISNQEAVSGHLRFWSPRYGYGESQQIVEEMATGHFSDPRLKGYYQRLLYELNSYAFKHGAISESDFIRYYGQDAYYHGKFPDQPQPTGGSAHKSLPIPGRFRLLEQHPNQYSFSIPETPDTWYVVWKHPKSLRASQYKEGFKSEKEAWDWLNTSGVVPNHFEVAIKESWPRPLKRAFGMEQEAAASIADLAKETAELSAAAIFSEALIRSPFARTQKEVADHISATPDATEYIDPATGLRWFKQTNPYVPNLKNYWLNEHAIQWLGWMHPNMRWIHEMLQQFQDATGLHMPELPHFNNPLIPFSERLWDRLLGRHPQVGSFFRRTGEIAGRALLLSKVLVSLPSYLKQFSSLLFFNMPAMGFDPKYPGNWSRFFKYGLEGTRSYGSQAPFRDPYWEALFRNENVEFTKSSFNRQWERWFDRNWNSLRGTRERLDQANVDLGNARDGATAAKIMDHIARLTTQEADLVRKKGGALWQLGRLAFNAMAEPFRAFNDVIIKGEGKYTDHFFVAFGFADQIAKRIALQHLVEDQGMSIEGALSRIDAFGQNLHRTPSAIKGFASALGGTKFTTYPYNQLQVMMNIAGNQPLWAVGQLFSLYAYNKGIRAWQGFNPEEDDEAYAMMQGYGKANALTSLMHNLGRMYLPRGMGGHYELDSLWGVFNGFSPFARGMQEIIGKTDMPTEGKALAQAASGMFSHFAWGSLVQSLIATAVSKRDVYGEPATTIPDIFTSFLKNLTPDFTPYIGRDWMHWTKGPLVDPKTNKPVGSAYWYRRFTQIHPVEEMGSWARLKAAQDSVLRSRGASGRFYGELAYYEILDVKARLKDGPIKPDGTVDYDALFYLVKEHYDSGDAARSYPGLGDDEIPTEKGTKDVYRIARETTKPRFLRAWHHMNPAMQLETYALWRRVDANPDPEVLQLVENEFTNKLLRRRIGNVTIRREINKVMLDAEANKDTLPPGVFERMQGWASMALRPPR